MTRFYESYWQERNEGKLEDFHLKWPKLRNYIPRNGETVCLDFGCGNGELIKEMMRLNPKAKYVGLDVSETALTMASEDVPEAEFHKIVDGGRFPMPDESVDFIFTSEVIEHVYDTENAFSEMSRILRPNGQVLLTTPYHGFIKNFLIALFAFDAHFDPTGPHVRFFSKKTLFSCLKKVRIKPKKYGYFGRIYPIPNCIFVLAEKVGYDDEYI